ncbi:N-acetylglucosaminyl transferase component [Strigomonas culicis]|uniref:N-acetylglucosaminyl transferase component n=1 Tax=Strigomonas culicis TaxID=28005 RepID=S9TV67_9TRYP|nr:N-acetylglucosaminyl transferase component [Strigomonas culicis]|eukprot:EPY20454.1 N-acetylglucosaminyl transferase component [Strigomonas culicis]
MGKNASMGDGRMSVADSFFVPNTSSYHPPQMEDVPLELLPPRLDFPTSTKNHSEMSMLLRLCYTGVNVSRVINSKTPYELKEEPNEMSRRTESSHLGEAMALNDTGVFILQVVIQLLLFALKVETAIAPFSFVAQTLEVRTRELINFFSMILGKTSTCGLHPVLPHKEHAVSFLMCTWSFLVRIFVDFLLGLSFYVCFHALFHHKFDSFPFYFLYDVHMSYMEWFAGWPAGFKANEDVNKILCFFSSVLLTMWNLIARGGVFLRVASFGGTMPLQESVLTAMQDAISVANSTCSAYNYQSSNVSTTVSFSLADRHPEVYVWLDFGVLLTCLFGASVALSAFADATRLASLHLTILFGIFSRLYDVVLSLIGSLSGLFRGLKYNPLRCRVDGHQFQTDQMLFASFFLVVICSLLPAVLVYYVYFMLIGVCVWLISLFFVNLGYLIMYLPTFEVFYWLCRRHRLVGSLYVSRPYVTMTRHFTTAGSRDPCTVQTVDLSLCTSPLPLYYMLTDFLAVLCILQKNVFPTQMLLGCLTGNMERVQFNTVEQLVPHLVANPEDPTCAYLKPNQDKKKK